jgi:hypothetical protein
LNAGAKNLQVTSGRVEEIIEQAQSRREKAIVFVTGVPGAGKTLVGLNVATRRRAFGEARAVFLSGNGPLVAVLQEALTRDEYRRLNGTTRKGAIRQQVKPFIQNVHHFRDEGVRTDAPPSITSSSSTRASARGTARRPRMVVTRDLTRAKDWVRARARGSEQYGLVASSQAMRLKPHAIDVRVSVDPVHWFLGEASDTRSSYYLEDAATESQVQGLEVDWACVTWDADLRQVDGGWRHHSFRGDVWTNVNKPDRQRYLLNAYRVLLTRARQGMAIFVPPGDRRDPTRLPKFYDGTFEYLRGVGLPEV